MKEFDEYRGYKLAPVPYETPLGRWAVAVNISRKSGYTTREKIFYEEGNIMYLLEEEAKKEAFVFGKRVIDEGLVGF